MTSQKKISLLFLTALAVLPCAASPSAAQYYQYPTPPPPIYAPYAGQGGYLRGTADVINAQGQYLQQQEQARITREQAYQEFLNSKKAGVEYNKWLEANTPTFTETQEKNKAMLTRRILNNPTTTEITSGQALNELLALLKQMAVQGVQGPMILLDQNMLAKISVMGPTQTGFLGVLGNTGQMDWPLALQGMALQKELAQAIPKVVTDTTRGTLNFKSYTKVRNDVYKLRKDVRDLYAKEELDGQSYLAADDFLEKLGYALVDLSKPGAAKVLSGGLKAVGNDVPALVFNMSSHGLKFAPSLPGNEQAYVSLQNALSAYAISANNSYGIQLQQVAPRNNFRVDRQ